MRFRNTILILTILPTVFLLSECKDEPNNPDPAIQGPVIPSYIPSPVYSMNDVTYDGPRFLLGKKLFFDPILSSDSTISCGSCHTQGHAFADHNLTFSIGVDGKKGNRNSPALFNLAWMPNFMWDGGINHIEVMPLAPITNPLEMNETMANVVKKLNEHPIYKSEFNYAFGTSEITDRDLFLSLSTFMKGLVSFNSRYDQKLLGGLVFTAEESAGESLFMQHCNSCHKAPLFTDYSYRNNGIDSTFSDPGRGLITLNSQDTGKFKVPSLRNIIISYPYMHDGRFRTIEQVLNHYSEGLSNRSTNDDLLKSSFHFTEAQKSQLIAFLKTLTDEGFLANPAYSER